ncbi:hypothetical protein ACTXT7_011433 [Hymenolepis weldensis]
MRHALEVKTNAESLILIGLGSLTPIERTMTGQNRFVSLILLILFQMPDIQGSTWRIPATEVKYRLPENSPPGQILGTVAGPSPQKGVTNALGAPSQFFQLDPITSELSLKAEIDAEKLCALTTKRDDEKGLLKIRKFIDKIDEIETGYKEQHGGGHKTLHQSIDEFMDLCGTN